MDRGWQSFFLCIWWMITCCPIHDGESAHTELKVCSVIRTCCITYSSFVCKLDGCAASYGHTCNLHFNVNPKSFIFPKSKDPVQFDVSEHQLSPRAFLFSWSQSLLKIYAVAWVCQTADVQGIWPRSPRRLRLFLLFLFLIPQWLNRLTDMSSSVTNCISVYLC